MLHGAGKLYMAPVCFQFWGANAGRYYEYSGYAGMRAMWMQAIEVTRNDFIEGSYVSPIGDPAAHPGANDPGASAAPPATLGYFHTHAGATALLAYFIQWYKTGAPPRLMQDAVFWAYQTVQSLHRDGTPPMKFYGPIRDAIYVTANLTAAAQLRVQFGPVSRILDLPAGSTDVQIPIPIPIPMTAGQAPAFTLLRRGRPVAHSSGADAIAADATYRDLYYSTGVMRSAPRQGSVMLDLRARRSLRWRRLQTACKVVHSQL